MSDLDDVTLDYRVAFQRYLPRRSEAALTDGYDLGRRAIVHGVSLLDLVHVHHVVLAEVLADTPREDVGRVTTAAGDFLLEVLATFDMAHRRLRTSSE
ncbi:phosphatase RsbU N-terminal domain-containing protein [Pedococcus sp. P5_B7]